MTADPQALDRLADAISDLDAALLPLLDSDDPCLLVDLREQVKAQRVRLAEIEAGLESAAVRRIKGKKLTLPDGRLVEVMGGWDRKWDHPRLAQEIAKRYAVPPSTGEMLI